MYKAARAVGIILLAAFVGAQQPASKPAFPVVPPETLAAYQKWMKAENPFGTSDYALASGPALQKLAALPDADLCFLYTTEVRRGKRDWLYLAAADELGKLNTQRSFDAICARLKSPNFDERWGALAPISAFKRPESVTLLVGVLESDPEPLMRRFAAESLMHFKDPRAEPAFVKAMHDSDPILRTYARSGLALMNSQAGLAPTLELIQTDPGRHSQFSIQAVGAYHRKAAVVAMLDLCEEFQRRDGSGTAGRDTEIVDLCLRQYAAAISKIDGPMPETWEQWRDWWAHTEPLLTDDLQPKVPVHEQKPYEDTEFVTTADRIELRASVDANRYRVGDPIRLNLEMENRSSGPASVVLPELPSGWWPTMAYGVSLTRGGATIVNLPPSDDYIGSYSGPPPFQTLAPGEMFRSNICLQDFLRHELRSALPEGEYVLTIAFDSSKFAFIQPKGSQLVHRWDAAPIHFTVQGEPRTDPAEILHQIGIASGLRWIETDLLSRDPKRHDRAWGTVFEYGDSRLQPFVENFEREHAQQKYYFLSAKNLPPFVYAPHEAAVAVPSATGSGHRMIWFFVLAVALLLVGGQVLRRAVRR